MASNPNKQGDTYTDIVGIVTPSSPASGTRRIYVNSTGGEHSVLTSDGIVVSLEATSRILATVASINLKNTGATTLYTVPTGKTLIINDIIVVLTASDTIAVAPTVRIGKSAAYTEWAPATALTNLAGVKSYISLNTLAIGLIRQTFVATEAVAIDVTVGATATTMTATAYLIGNLV